MIREKELMAYCMSQRRSILINCNFSDDDDEFNKIERELNDEDDKYKSDEGTYY